VLPIIVDVLNAFLLVLLARVILSYIPSPPGSVLGSISRVCETITEPVLRPIRRIVPPLRVGGSSVDMSPIVVWVLVLVIARLL